MDENHANLSQKTIDLLEKSGWTPDRRIDINDYIESELRLGGKVLQPARQFLEEFGDLEIKKDAGTSKKAILNFKLSISNSETSSRGQKGWSEWLYRYEEYIGDKLCSIGLYVVNHTDLLMDTHGQVYGVFTEYVALMGKDGYEAIENMINSTDKIKYLGELS